MTIRDLVVSFGFELDQSSERQVESSIKGLKSMASKLLGVIGIAFSIKGLSDLAQAAGDAEALKSQFSQVFGDLEDDATSRLNAIADDTGVFVNRMKGSFVQIAAFSKTTGMEQAEALEIADRAMQAVTDSAAFYDRSIEQVTESMQSFLKGNYENDAALGLSCTEVTRNAAANELYSKSFKDLSEAEKQFTLLKMVEDANKASGALGQAARESDTWTNQLGNLQQSLVDLKAAVGSTFLKPAVAVLKLLSTLAQQAAKAINSLTEENGLLTKATERYHALVKRLHPAIERMSQAMSRGMNRGIEVANGVVNKLGGVENVLKIIAIAASAFLLVMNWSKLISGAKAFMNLISGIGKLFSLSNLKVLGIVAVITAIVLIIEDFVHFLMGHDSLIGSIFDKLGIGAENARNAIFTAFGKARDFLLKVWDKVLPVWQAVQEALLAVWESLCESLISLWTALREAGSAVFKALCTVIKTVFRQLKAFWNQWGSQIMSYFRTVWNTMGRVANDFLEVITGIANFVKAVFTGDWESAWDSVKDVFSHVWDAIKDILRLGWEGIKTASKIAVEELPGLLENGWNLLKSAVSAVADALPGLLSAGWEKLKELAIAAVEALPGLLAGAWDLFTGAISAVGDELGPLLDAGWNLLKDAGKAAIEGFPDFLSGAWELLKSGITAVGEGLGPLLDAGWNLLKNAGKAAIEGFPDFLGGAWNTLKSGITAIGNTFGPLLDAGWNLLKDAGKTAIEGFPDAIGSAWTLMKNGIIAIGNTLGPLLNDGWNALKDAAGPILEQMPGVVGEGLSLVKDGIIEFGEGLGGLLDSGWELLKEAAGGAADWIQEKWNGVKSFFAGIWDSITGGSNDSASSVSDAGDVVAGAGSSFEEASTAMGAAGEAAASAGDSFSAAGQTIVLSMGETAATVSENVTDMQTSMSEGWEAIRTATSTVWNQIKAMVDAAWTLIKSKTSSEMSSLKSTISTGWNTIRSTTSTTWNSIKSTISSSMSQARSLVSSGVSGIKSSFNSLSSLSSSAYKWGHDIGQLMSNGIKDSAGSVVAAANNVASQVKSVLHFSVPDTGPLSDADTYMPDFMELLAKGISENKGTVLNNLKSFAGDMQMLMSAATAGTATAGVGMISNRTSSVVQNVNISNKYSGGSTETQRNVSKAMKKSAVDATTQMARGLAYARG